MNEYETEVRDLMDFILRWSEFRQRAIKLRESERLRPEEQLVLKWLIEIADRVRKEDI